MRVSVSIIKVCKLPEVTYNHAPQKVIVKQHKRPGTFPFTFIVKQLENSIQLITQYPAPRKQAVIKIILYPHTVGMSPRVAT